MAPLVRRTWAPCGQTPLHYQRTRHHRKVSAIAALLVSPGRERVRLCFRLHPDTNLRAGELIAFVRQLLAHVRGPVVLIWDRWRRHRARLLQTFVAGRAGRGSGADLLFRTPPAQSQWQRSTCGAAHAG